MPNNSERRWLAVSGVVALILVTAACPVPMRYTDRLAPALVGVLRSETGAPVSGVVLAVSTHEDCRRPTAFDTTDSAGAFRIPPSDRQRRMAWIGPFEFPPPRPFYLCADSTFQPRVVYTNGVPAFPIGKPPLLPESLKCMQARRENRIVLTCVSQVHQQ
jgi:hypothetical protein